MYLHSISVDITAVATVLQRIILLNCEKTEKNSASVNIS